MNKVLLIGRLTRSPEIRKTATGLSVCDFTLAVNRKIKQDGQPEADFIGCIAWNKTADLMYQYLNKGSLIGVEGRIQTSNYENKKGEKIYKTHVAVESIEFLEQKKNAGNETATKPINTYEAPESPYSPQKQANNQGYMYGESLTASAERKQFENDTLVINDDDLPF